MAGDWRADEALKGIFGKGLTYSAKDFGRPILDLDLAWGDLIVLAFAFSDELDSLDAPIVAP